MPITHSETPRGLISLISFVGATRRFQTGRARVVGLSRGPKSRSCGVGDGNAPFLGGIPLWSPGAQCYKRALMRFEWHLMLDADGAAVDLTSPARSIAGLRTPVLGLPPPAVSPHSRERCVVGNGVYGLDERGEGSPRSSVVTTSRRSQPISGSTIFGCQRPGWRRRLWPWTRVNAFCYYHYWFEGRRVLEKPFKAVLSSGEPDFPFCLCLATQSWTRGWNGRDGEVLVRQGYSEHDDLIHIRWLAEAFSDSRYLTICGRPVFLVYRAPASLTPSGRQNLAAGVGPPRSGGSLPVLGP